MSSGQKGVEERWWSVEAVDPGDVCYPRPEAADSGVTLSRLVLL